MQEKNRARRGFRFWTVSRSIQQCTQNLRLAKNSDLYVAWYYKTFKFSCTQYNLLKKLKRHIFFIIRYTIFFKIQRHITDIDEGKCIKEMGLRCVVKSRVTTAGMLMQKNTLGRDNRAWKRGPHRRQEQVGILERISNVDSCTNNSRKARPSICSSSAMHDTIRTL